MSGRWDDERIEALLERMDVLCENTHGLLGQIQKEWVPVGSPGWADRGARAPAIGPLGGPGNPGPGPAKLFEWTNKIACRHGDPALSVSLAVALSDQNTAAVLAAGANLDFSDAFVLCSFGTSNRGPESLVELDLIDGTAFQIIGNRATFWLNYPVTTANGATSPLLDVSLSLGLGATGGVGNVPRRTKKVGNLNQNQESAQVAIPPFAHLAVLQVKDTTTQVQIKQYGSGGATLLSQAPIGQAQSNAVPVTNGARFFTLTNTGGGTTGAAVVFFLSPA